MSFSLLQIDLDTISMIEELRFDAYDISGIDSSKTYYANEIRKGKFIAFGAFYQGELIGSCYVSNSGSTLYIEQLFVSKAFQKTNLHVGSNLLKYVLSQKDYIEDYFNCNFHYSCLDSINNTDNLYKRVGYVKTREQLMKKRLY